MVRPVAFFVDGERTPIERLGLGESVGVLQQVGEVIEAGRDDGMVRPEVRFVDNERAGIEPLRLGVDGLCFE